MEQIQVLATLTVRSLLVVMDIATKTLARLVMMETIPIQIVVQKIVKRQLVVMDTSNQVNSVIMGTLVILINVVATVRYPFAVMESSIEEKSVTMVTSITRILVQISALRRSVEIA